MKENLETIKALIEVFLEKMTVSAEVELLEKGEFYYFVIKTREAGMLIGDNGQNLSALNHIIKKIAERTVNHEGERGIPFILDVNDYHMKKIEDLKSMARMQAQRVRYFKKEIPLPAMTPYERRVVHSILTEYPDITTESTGEDPDRKVVIKPLLK